MVHIILVVLLVVGFSSLDLFFLCKKICGDGRSSSRCIELKEEEKEALLGANGEHRATLRLVDRARLLAFLL